MAPSPSVFLAAVAQRTRRLRFGPLVYTLSLHHPLRVAEEICMLDQMSGGRLELGVGRGVSVQHAFATYLAQVAEVEVSKDGAVRVRRVVCAVDCGTVVNPDTVQAQIQSAVIFGITAALYGQITLKDGRVEQTNFDSYQILRINEAPAIEVYIIQSSEPPGGMGEAGTSAIVPAVSNAIYAATGRRLRKLPIDPTVLKQPV